MNATLLPSILKTILSMTFWFRKKTCNFPAQQFFGQRLTVRQFFFFQPFSLCRLVQRKDCCRFQNFYSLIFSFILIRKIAGLNLFDSNRKITDLPKNFLVDLIAIDPIEGVMVQIETRSFDLSRVETVVRSMAPHTILILD